MNKRMRRILTAVLVVVMVVGMLAVLPMQVRADIDSSSSITLEQAQRMAANNEAIQEEDTKNLAFYTIDTKATSGIRWRTIGYTITAERDDNYSPQNTYKGEYVVINGRGAHKSEDLGGGKLFDKYTISYNTVETAIKNGPKKLRSKINKNGYFYIHMIGESYEVGVGVNKTNLTSVALLQNAEEWDPGTMQDFYNHFNKKVTWDFDYVPEVKIKYVEYSSQFNGTEVDCETDNWKDLKSERVLKSETNRKTVKLKDYLKGSESITDDNGETYLLSSIRYYAGDAGWQMMHSDHVMTMRKRR